MKIVTLSGSLRRGSYNTALLKQAEKYVPPGVTLEACNIELPLYNADLSEQDKADVRVLNEQIAAAAAVLIATPEYNYGIPGPLKNALDWASRPAYKSVFSFKPVGIVGAAGGAIGTARAQGQLKQVLLGMAAQVFPQPEFLVGQAGSKFDDAGELTDLATQEHLARFLARFVAWVKVAEKYRPES
jgi:chromate reductase